MVVDMKQKKVGSSSYSDLVGRDSREVATKSDHRGPRLPSASQHVGHGESEESGRDARRIGTVRRRHESWHTVQVVLGVVAAALGLIAAAISFFGPGGESGGTPVSIAEEAPSALIRSDDTRAPSPITEILAELQVSEADWAFIEGLTERFVAEASNPSRDDVVEYVRLKESVISQVRFMAGRGGRVAGPGAANVDLAFRQGNVEFIESLVSAEQEDEEVAADVMMLTELGPQRSPHFAI